eukprot:1790162-Pleurochrysis_carterae.AAC.1
MNDLKAQRIVDEGEQVLETSRQCAHERTSYVGMSGPAGIRCLVEDGVISVFRCVGFVAGRTALETSMGERRWSVGGDGRQGAQASVVLPA